MGDSHFAAGEIQVVYRAAEARRKK